MLRAVNSIREVYGIRKIVFREAAGQVTVEYDATRLTPAVVRQLLRGAGLDATELPAPVELATPIAESAPAGAPPAPAK